MIRHQKALYIFGMMFEKINNYVLSIRHNIIENDITTTKCQWSSPFRSYIECNHPGYIGWIVKVFSEDIWKYHNSSFE